MIGRKTQQNLFCMKFINLYINYHTLSTPGDLEESSYTFSI